MHACADYKSDKWVPGSDLCIRCFLSGRKCSFYLRISVGNHFRSKYRKSLICSAVRENVKMYLRTYVDERARVCVRTQRVRGCVLFYSRSPTLSLRTTTQSSSSTIPWNSWKCKGFRNCRCIEGQVKPMIAGVVTSKSGFMLLVHRATISRQRIRFCSNDRCVRLRSLNLPRCYCHCNLQP